ncbi:MurR/RpiR family transcriptional regulator [Streptococcus merionis]|uniref:MurR/RpiR family transcriptional regulator n=1 Tax=Streptococcus merionis TaxID=400065 RepID=UPI003519D7A9
MFLFQRVEEFIVHRQDANAVIGHFLLDKRLEIHQYSMADIAKETFTSKATLVRFAQALGYSGWKEFFYAYTHEAASEANDDQPVDPNFPFQSDDDSLTIVSHLMALKIQALRDTAKVLDTADLDDAAEIIFKANRVVLYGISPNSEYASLFRRRLISLGKTAMVAQKGDAGTLSRFLTKADCAIFISYTGNLSGHYPLNFLPLLQENQVPIVALTSGGNSYLVEMADVVLPIYSREKLYSKISNFATEESILFLLDSLYAKIFSMDYDHHRKLKIGTSRILEKGREAKVSDMSE